MNRPQDDWQNAVTDPWEERNLQLSRLIVSSRAREVHAFEELYRLTARWMLSRIRRIVDDGQAEDVLADAYIQIWGSLDSYDESRSAPASWMAMIARSRALDHLRRERRRLDDAARPEFPERWNDDGPEEMLSRSQDAKLLHVSMSVLDCQERLVVGLAYFRDYTQSQIASLTGLPLGTVKTLMHRSQQKLRVCFFGAAQAPASDNHDAQAAAEATVHAAISRAPL